MRLSTISPFDLVMPSENAYFFVCPEETANRPKIRLFRDRIIKEAAVQAFDMDTIVNVAFPVFAVIGSGYAAGHL
ncbi:MAG: hypothetical protein VXZ99_10710 [Pseudomonadota bacterium]|nr:hypothetical protein [Pseudomonadota bacterium]